MSTPRADITRGIAAVFPVVGRLNLISSKIISRIPVIYVKQAGILQYMASNENIPALKFYEVV